MNRKDFIKKSVMGAAAVGVPLAAVSKSQNHNTTSQVGYEHITKNESLTNNMKTIFHKATERGHANHGWLNAHHSFSFANYYNPDKMNFGVLRVLNDDIIAPGMGFGKHPHDNMEIVTIPLRGDLEHKDSMGNTSVIKHMDVQIMSAGTGIFHSEYNKNTDKDINLLQIWVFPKQHNITPRYDQKTYLPQDRINKFQTIVSPEDDGSVWINQDAWFQLGIFEASKNINYKINKPGNGVYAFVIDGQVQINNQTLGKRDALGIYDTTHFEMQFLTKTEILLIEVPMNIS
ncbi:MAG: pirin family protein [Cytophagales bacterium]|nr:pirin family protein [Cytophagales bacterium]